MGDILPIVGRRASVGRSRRVARYLRGRSRLIEVRPLRRAEEIIDFHRRLRLDQEVGRVHLHIAIVEAVPRPAFNADVRETQHPRKQRGRFPEMTNRALRSEEHTSELQSIMRISYAVFCLKKKNHSQIKRTCTLTSNT